MLSSQLLKQSHLQKSINTLRLNSSLLVRSQKPIIAHSYTQGLYQSRDFSKVRTIKSNNIASLWNINMDTKMASNFDSYVLHSKKDEKEDAPKGFEKFFKKNKETKEEEKPEKKEAAQKEDDKDDDLTEDESDDKKDKEGKEEDKDKRDQVSKMLFDPNNNPRPESWVPLLGALGALYYMFVYKTPAEEIVFMEFYNEYMLKNRVKEITLIKDPRSQVFNVKAEILTHEGERKYLVINTIDSFLQKLDIVQREMGKQPHEFVPVKVTNESENDLKANMMNLAIGCMFAGFFYQIYKGRNGNKPSTGKKTGKSGEEKKGGLFGGGGMNDMFGMSKSNAKEFGGENG